MTTISLKDAGFIARGHLFQNLTVTFGPGDRVGLVAQNGAGKSTLLRCLAEEAELSHGEISRSRGARVGYMPQDIAPGLLGLTCREAVRDALSPDVRESESWRVDMMLDQLETPEVLRDTDVAALSGGWQRLVLLARVWVGDPDVLLMDEPTNHLDLRKILMLETWLSTWLGDVPMVVASHDRRFLDSVTNRTVFLRPGTSHLFPLSYTRARYELERIDRSEAAQAERQMNEANRLRRQSSKLKNIGINSGSDLLLKKQKQLRERAEQIEEQVGALHSERAGDIRLTNRGTHAKALIRIEDLEVSTPDGRLLFRIPSLNVLPGDRLVILGRNGCGKSTLVRLLRDVLVDGREVAGVRGTPSLVTGYMDQSMSDVPLDRTPFDFIAPHVGNDPRARSVLANAGIAFDWQDRPIEKLSLGQRSRLALLALRFAEPNFYLLDEPTNHVDIAGQEALAAEIHERQASCILISHDRAFVEDVGNRFIEIDRGRVREADEPAFEPRT